MRTVSYTIITIIFVALALFFVWDSSSPSALQNDTEKAASQNDRGNTIKAIVVFPRGLTIIAAIADTDIERAQGLSYRPFSQSMLFLFDTSSQPSFWMKDMNFALDFIWLRNKTVVGIVENARPEYPVKTLYTPDVPIDMVLEVPSGTVLDAGLRVGDALDITFNAQ